MRRAAGCFAVLLAAGLFLGSALLVEARAPGFAPTGRHTLAGDVARWARQGDASDLATDAYDLAVWAGADGDTADSVAAATYDALNAARAAAVPVALGIVLAMVIALRGRGIL